MRLAIVAALVASCASVAPIIDGGLIDSDMAAWSPAQPADAGAPWPSCGDFNGPVELCNGRRTASGLECVACGLGPCASKFAERAVFCVPSCSWCKAGIP